MNAQYRIPLGNGKTKVTLWTNYMKYKFTKPDLWWLEDTPIKVFPDCKRTLGEK
jgi:hypothetical protein|tara:strand:+ start:500 stop:661 length:162 start_codon:yes stop_codon:yes gene_type:complete